MQCPHCAKEIPDGSVVCSFCAAPLDESPTAAPTDVGDAPTAMPDDAEAPTSFPDDGLAEAATAMAPAEGTNTPTAGPTSTPPVSTPTLSD